MRVLSGKKIITMNLEELQYLTKSFSIVHVDMGAGSGKFIYKSAMSNLETFYIGIDPVANQMFETSTKAQKRKMMNILYVNGSVEAVPVMLEGIADSITVILPWGSLRDGIVKANTDVLTGLRFLGKPGTKLTIWIGYDDKHDATEIKLRELPHLSKTHFLGLLNLYKKSGINIENVSLLDNAELKSLESDWAKRLAYGNHRNTFKLSGNLW